MCTVLRPDNELEAERFEALSGALKGNQLKPVRLEPQPVVGMALLPLTSNAKLVGPPREVLLKACICNNYGKFFISS